MTPADEHEDRRRAGETFEGTIGVGIGGSCPVCRAPIDLAQEFCLECGSPIRFTPRQRRGKQQGSARPAPAPLPPPKSGFPWIPFLVVLTLIGGAGAFALLGGNNKGSDRADDPASTDAGLPTITNSQPPTTSQTPTTTLQDCLPEADLQNTEPALADPNPTDGFDLVDPSASTTSDQIPQLAPGTAPLDDPGSAFDVPSTDQGSEVGVTVDQNGTLCDTIDDGVDPLDDPASDAGDSLPGGSGQDTPTTQDPAATTPPDPATASGDWPAGRDAWTVIVAGYEQRQRAQQRAADVQSDSFDGGGTLFSTDYPSLCPGFYIVFNGVFDTETQATSRMKEIAANPDYAGMYVRQIRSTGNRPATCS